MECFSGLEAMSAEALLKAYNLGVWLNAQIWSTCADMLTIRSRIQHQSLPDPAPPAAFFDENHARRAGTGESLVPSSQVLHVLDQGALIFVGKLVAVVMT